MYIHNATAVAAGATLSAVAVRAGECLVPAWSNRLRQHVEAIKVKEFDGNGGIVNYRQRLLIGHAYAIQSAPNCPALCRRRLVSVRRANAHQMSNADAIALGYQFECYRSGPPGEPEAWSSCELPPLAGLLRDFDGDVWLLEWEDIA